ncbi:MAG: hypothetical protein VKJ46_16690 [Leptolyngbyaceae bacterium]|nr:hypothetical protein [Leptolyngbyaceae bacterium]
MKFATISGLIRRQFQDVEREYRFIGELMNEAEERQDDRLFLVVAMGLHGFYTGIEKIFETIAKQIDGSSSGDSGWHKDLLLQMSAKIANIRPEVITPSTYELLLEFLAFRHVVRNNYTHKLEPERIRQLVQNLNPCYSALENDLTNFCQFLDEMNSHS